MFVTLHVKLLENKVSSITVVSKNEILTIKNNKEAKRQFIKNIENGRYVVIRVIFERIIPNKAIEYHCFDFNKQSFIISDTTHTVRNSREIIDFIEDLDENFRILYGTKKLEVYVLKEVTQINVPKGSLPTLSTVIPTNDQAFFHKYVSEMSDDYLI